MYWILGKRSICVPCQTKASCYPNCSPSHSSSTCCFFHPHHFPFLSDFPAAMLCNFVVSSRREFLCWLWSERAGQSHSLPQIGARCHQGSWSDGEHCLGCVCVCWFYLYFLYDLKVWTNIYHKVWSVVKVNILKCYGRQIVVRIWVWGLMSNKYALGPLARE